MELKAYLQILLKKWWIVIPIFLVTLTSGIVFTYTKTPIYNATSTYLVVPSSAFGDLKSFASGLDMLGRRTEIATTFSEISTSRAIKTQALDSLGLSSGADYIIDSKLRAGTSIIEFTVEGPDPVVVRDLANTVGKTTETYVQGLYEVFVLLLLDEASLPRNFINPNVPLNLAMSAILGLALGVGVAFLAVYLEAPIEKAVSISVMDDDTGVYNKPYFLQRLTEEMVRARRNKYPLSLALMRIDNLDLLKGANSTKVRAEVLRQVAKLATQYLREEDVVAYMVENSTFAFLLPDTSGENAKSIMEYLQTRVAWTPFEASNNGMKFNIGGVVGIVAYDHNGTTRNELIEKAYQALQLAEVGSDGKAHLSTDLPTPGDTNASENKSV